MENTQLEQVATSKIDSEDLLRLFHHMYTSVEVDRQEQTYTRSGDAFFHVAGRGHEAGAALNQHLVAGDWLSCHYRSKALMLARGMSLQNIFGGFFAKDDSHSRGRQMSAHLSSPAHHITSIAGPVGNNALTAVGIAAEIAELPDQPISVCCLGEGTTQQGEVLEALHEARRCQLPVLFVVEDNGLAISTPTAGQTFYTLGGSDAAEYGGIPVRYLDGSDALQCHHRFGDIVARMRHDRGPAIAVLRTRRLSDHTNADDQSVYRQAADIDLDAARACPVARLEKVLLERGCGEALKRLKAQVQSAVRSAAEKALAGADPQACREAAAPLPACLTEASGEYLGQSGGKRLTMIEAMRAVLQYQLANNPRVSLYGQDIEDPKGDVFGLTRGLSSQFPQRVRNAPLSESTIVGTAVGRALTGARPVAMLQFADFLPLAFNQICSEISTMYWRTDGGWQCPVLIMAPCGGYRPGLGHFHAQSFESIAAHLPGIDVMLPSSAADAAAQLNAAFQAHRPTLFFYPKALLNDRDQTTSDDIERHLAAIGRARVLSYGDDLTLVAWGNTVARAQAAAALLAEQGKRCEVIDLRFLAPWDKATVIKSAAKTRHLLVIHEDSHSCGMGAEILATVTEALPRTVECRRLTRPDIPIPCNFANQLEILPSVRATVDIAADMLGLDVSWEAPLTDSDTLLVVEAIGASPSDETVTINHWRVNTGQHVARGDLLVEYEADKAVTELLSPQSGVVEHILVDEGACARVGAPLLLLRLDDGQASHRKPLTRELLTTPHFKRRATEGKSEGTPVQRTRTVGIKRITPRCGSTNVDTSFLLERFATRSTEDTEKTTGIARRPRAIPGETAASLAADACRQLLADEALSLSDIDTIICSTGTPELITPSTACQIMALIDPAAECAAYDFHAACAGYVYALQQAWDRLQAQPDARILVVTTELLSPLLDPEDYATSILFGDAATATLLCGESQLGGCHYTLRRPHIAAQADTGNILTVPPAGTGRYLRMDGGPRVFSTGVRKMTQSLRRALDEAGLGVDDIPLIVPHQANQRIINAIAKKLNLPNDRVYSNVRHRGNTSSSSIPLALAELWEGGSLPSRIALTAFGGGFAYGAALLESGGD